MISQDRYGNGQHWEGYRGFHDHPLQIERQHEIRDTATGSLPVIGSQKSKTKES